MLTHSNKIWISANAGSGKTYRLVKHIVALLIQGAKPSSVLCLTYTKAAASEMQSRLLRRLEEFTALSEQQLQVTLNDILDRPATAQEVMRAKKLLLEMIDATPGVGFFTLHSFCQRILSSFPLEAGISPHASLMDDEQSALLQQKAIELTFTKAITNPALSSAVRALQTRSADSHVQKMLIDSLAQRRNWQEVFSTLDTIEQLKDKLSAYFSLHEYDLINSHEAHYTTAHLHALRALIPAANKGTANDINNASRLDAWCENPYAPNPEISDAQIEESWQDYCNIWMTNTGEKRKRPFTKKVTDTPEFAETIAREQAYLERFLERQANLEAATSSYHFSALCFHCHKAYETLKARDYLMDYDDLLTRATALLSDEKMRPWVMQMLDYRIEHLLIDEAQDTSADQWRILSALISELWQAGLLKDRSLLVVGDVKQSIYGFQGAEPSYFPLMRKHIQQILESNDDTLSKQSLGVSYRSVPVILSLVETVLGELEKKNLVQIEDEKIAHSAFRGAQAGKVVCFAATTQDKAHSNDKIDKIAPTNDYMQTISKELKWVNQIADMIAGWLHEKRVIAARQRPVEPGDILILLQSRKPLADMILHALEKRHIPVSGLDRLKLNTHLAVIDFLAFFNWCVHPYDDLNLAIALRSPLGNMSEETLCDIAWDRKTDTLWESLLKRAPSHPVITQFEQYREIALHNPPDKTLHILYQVFELKKACGERFGAEIHEVLDAFAHEASCYSAAYTPSLLGFIHHMQALRKELKRENSADANAVRVMTAHGAKGLEAPIVICADATHVADTRKETVFFVLSDDAIIPLVRLAESKNSAYIRQAIDAKNALQNEEYYRLLYVALTRAEDELYLGGVAKRSGSKENDESPDWLQVVRSAMHTMPNCYEKQDETLEIETFQGEGLAPYLGKHSAVSSALNIALPAWYSAPQNAVVQADVTPRIYSPSLFQKAQMATPKKMDASATPQADRGVLMHRVLQWIARVKPQSMTALSEWIAVIAPQWHQEHIQKAATDIWRVWRDEAYQFLWQENTKYEVSLIGTLLIHNRLTRFSGQIDVLAYAPEYRVIIDYKTSDYVPEKQSIPAHYLMQMAIYKALLEKDEEMLPVRTALLYTNAPQVIWVDDILPDLNSASLDGWTNNPYL